MEKDYQCPECGSTNVITRVDGSRFCRRCGCNFNTEEKED